VSPRIRELAKQSGVWEYYEINEGVGEDEKHLEKFAQLIVRECANRIDYWESRQGEHSDDLLKHFGVI
jgi:hypothetical protein